MPTTTPGGMAVAVAASQSYKLSGLIKYESYLSPEFLASRGAMLSLYASLEGVIREVSALRRLGAECTSTFRRFQESLSRLWEGGEGGSGPLTLEQRAFPPALEGTLALLQEDRLVVFLDRFTLGINGILLPAFEESQVLQQLVLDSLLERLRVAEASHALHDLAGKADAIVKSIAASSSFYTAAIAFAGKEAEAAAGFRQLFAKVRAEVVATAAEVCTSLERSSATFARAVGVAVGAVAELSLATSGEVGALGLAPPGPGIAWLLEGGVGGEASGAPSSSTTTTTTTTTLTLLGGEKVIIGLEGTKNERTGVLGNLYATNFRLLWVPQHVRVEGASSSPASSPVKAAASSGSSSEGGISNINSSSSSSGGNGALRMSKLTTVAIKASGWSLDPNLVTSLGAPYHDGILSFPLCSISRLDAVAGAVILVTSDMRVGAFSHTKVGSGGSAGDLVQRLSPMVWSPTPTFAVSHTLPTPHPNSPPSSSTTPTITPGWEFHTGKTLEKEFERMMGHWPAARGLARFRLAPDLNANYAICSTYPSTLIVPSSLTDAQLIAAAKYRSRGRLAAVVWFSGSVSLSRCAQPRSGLLAARSGDDERLLESLGTLERHLTLIRDAAKRLPLGESVKSGGDGGGGGGGGSSGSGEPQTPTIALSKVDDSVTLHIMDARPRINALVNSARGGGAENVANYKQCAMSYLNIDNIHFVRDALSTLRSAILRTGRSDLVAWLHSEHSLRLGGGGNGVGGSFPPTLSSSFLSGGVEGGGGETSSLFASRVSIPSYSSTATASTPATPSIRDGGEGGGGAGAFSSPRALPTHPISPPTARPTLPPPTTPTTPYPPSPLLVEGGEGEGEEPSSTSKKSSIARFLKGTRRFLQGGKTKSEKAEREDAFLAVTRVSSVMGRTPSYASLNASTGPPSTPMPDSPTVGGGGGGEGGVGVGWDGGEGEDKGVYLAATLRSPLAYKKPPKGSHAPHWFKLIATLLEGANAVAKSLLDGVSVVVHCSDGWDRTSGLTSLSMLLIDPHYRTLEGLCTLLAREWCNFGHKFGRRCGSGAGDHNREDSKDDQRAPIFLQFVDALWQVTRQHPTAFEFNERALAALVDHSYSGAFGTFLLDCEKERIKGAIPTSTPSLWDLFVGEGTREAFTNPLYGRAAREGDLAWGRETVDPALPLLPSRASLLKLDCDVMSIALWPLWVLRFSQ